MRWPTEIPDETEFTAIPGAVVVDRAPQDGFWRYQFQDPDGVLVRFSFDRFQRSVQTTLVVGGVEVCTVSQEGATKIAIQDSAADGKIICEFATSTTRSTLRLWLAPRIRILWGTLVDED